jgi:thiosulfate/3-mercaptopyruvate sulfurtransferase
LLVAYDEGSNAVAARLWWLMKYFGQRAALLDGGLAAWVASGRPLESGEPHHRATARTELVGAPGLTVDASTILRSLGGDALLVLDARASQRFSGEVENLDSRAGHIPGARNRPFGSNLGPEGRFKEPRELREEFAALVGNRDTAAVVHSCGSGVTACHNLFAMELAGLGGTRLYPGSWSEWIRDPARPIATGC